MLNNVQAGEYVLAVQLPAQSDQPPQESRQMIQVTGADIEGLVIVTGRGVGRTLEGAIYGVDPFNLFTFVVVAVTLLLAALVACVVPARRAAAVDPMVALRQD